MVPTDGNPARVTTLDSTYAKPFLTIPEQIRQLRARGMDCGPDAYAATVLRRYGYYRLSGYWHVYRGWPEPPTPHVDGDGHETRLDTFVDGTTLERVVALYEFDQDLRVRLGATLGTIETALRFFMGHRLGRIDAFAHRKPVLLGALAPTGPGEHSEATAAYREWLEEYDRHEARARGDFVSHFRRQYGNHLPIWVATEVMSFGVLSSLYTLMPQRDQEILAARFQVYAADGRADRGALANWLNSLRHVRNICAHYGRVWNRVFDVLIDAPGQARRDPGDLLASLADGSANNRLYGVLVIMRHVMLSIAPECDDVLDVVTLIVERTGALGVDMVQLGFPDDWENCQIWARDFRLDTSSMRAANLLDRVACLTAPQVREALTTAEPSRNRASRTPEQQAAAERAARKALLRTYLKYRVIMEIELGGTKYYPAFQFRDGKIIDALAEHNKAYVELHVDECAVTLVEGLLDWWENPSRPMTDGGAELSPLTLLSTVEFAAASPVHTT